MDTTVLRVLAIVLIANSHLEDFYPFRPLAADGLIGNSLFFMLSGLGLSLSPRIGGGGFVAWHRRRFARIYPSLWITVIVGTVLIDGAWQRWSPLDAVRGLAWPTPYAFIAQIVAFYPAFYLLKAARNRGIELAVMLGLCVPYAAVAAFQYDLHVLSWIFYFQVMVFGGLMAARVESLVRAPRTAGAILAGFLAVYVAVKLAMVTGRIPTHVAALHLLTYPILWGLLAVCASPTIQALARRSRLAPTLAVLAGLTLEIYLVHDFVRMNPRVRTLAFPLNIAVFWAGTLVLAGALALAADRVRRVMKAVPRDGSPAASSRAFAVAASPETAR